MQSDISDWGRGREKDSRFVNRETEREREARRDLLEQDIYRERLGEKEREREERARDRVRGSEKRLVGWSRRGSLLSLERVGFAL